MADLSTNIPQISFGQADKETAVNELFDAASPSMLFGRNGITSAGLNFGIFGGRWNGVAVANKVLALTDNSTLYISASLSTGDATFQTGSFKTGEMPLYKVTTSGGLVTAYEDRRAAYGIGIPEAPTDGKQYARKDAGWAEVAASGGDMEAATYDPQGIEDDAFDRANHTGTQPMASIGDKQGKVLDDLTPLLFEDVDSAVEPKGYLVSDEGGFFDGAQLFVQQTPEGLVTQTIHAPLLGQSGFRTKPVGGAWSDFATTIAQSDIVGWHGNTTAEAPNAVINDDGTFSRSMSALVPEAPTDSKQYARKDAAWVEAGDMGASTYDPQGIEDDAFDRGNHTGTQPMASIGNKQGKVLDDPVIVSDGDIDSLMTPGGYLFDSNPDNGIYAGAAVLVSATDGYTFQQIFSPISGVIGMRYHDGASWLPFFSSVTLQMVQAWYDNTTTVAPNAVINDDGSFSRSLANVVTGPASSVDGQMVVFDGVSGRVVKGVSALSTTGNSATIPMSQLATSSALNGKINKPASAWAGALTMFADGTGSNVLSSTNVGSTRYFIPNIDVRNEYPVPYDGVMPNSGSRTEFKCLNSSVPGTSNPVTKDAPGVVSALPTPSGPYANITTLTPWNDPSGGMPTQLCYADNGLFIRRGSAGWSLSSTPVNSSWTASTVTSLNDIRHATAQNRTYFFFKCTTAGTTGTTEPVWPTTDGGTVVDGTVVWTAYAYWLPWKVIPTANYASLTDLPANAYVDSSGNISRSTAVICRRVAVPASSTSAGVLGDWSSDANYLYVCHATNTWRRTAVSTF